mmetsp:Transcript_13649/g.36911  ORF Transcript_13649/g.36911 Transcript_13649/m.36911 type:complete len:245 (+) Transcript_13649:488-1222(+)
MLILLPREKAVESSDEGTSCAAVNTKRAAQHFTPQLCPVHLFGIECIDEASFHQLHLGKFLPGEVAGSGSLQACEYGLGRCILYTNTAHIVPAVSHAADGIADGHESMQDGRRAPCLLRFIGLRLLLALLLVLSVEVVLLLIHLPEGIVQEDAQHAPTGIWVCQNDDLTCPVDQSLQPPLSMAGLHSVPVTDVHRSISSPLDCLGICPAFYHDQAAHVGELGVVWGWHEALTQTRDRSQLQAPC